MAELEVEQTINANNRIRHTIFGVTPTYAKVELLGDDPETQNTFADYITTEVVNCLSIALDFDDGVAALDVDAGATIAADAWINYVGNAQLNLQWGGADRVQVDTAAVIIPNTPLQMTTQTLEFAADNAEGMRSDGTEFIWEVNSADRLRLSTAALYPHSSELLDLGTTDREWHVLYMGHPGTIYFGLGQDVNLYRAGANSLETDDDFSANTLEVSGNTVIDNARKFWAVDLDVFGTADIANLVIETSFDCDQIDINATGVGSVTAVIPVTVEAGTNYIAVYDSYS